MKHVERNLLEGEKIIEKAEIHWVLFLQAIIYTGIAAALFFVHTFLGVLGSLIAIYSWLRSAVVYFTDEFIITNKRVILRRGLIRNDTLEIQLQKLESVSVNQSILGRMLGYGVVFVAGTGTTRMGFNNIKGVNAFRNKIESMR